MIGKRSKQSVPVPPDVAEAEPAEPGQDETAPASFADQACSAEHLAEDAHARAVQIHGQAEEAIAAAQAEAGKLIAAAQAEARGFAAEGERLADEARAAEQRAQMLRHAATLQGRAGEAAALATALSDERERLGGQMADADARLAGLNAQRQEVSAGLEAARQSAEVDLIATLRGRLEAIEEALAALAGQRATAQARSDLIGDGSQGFPGELSRAISAAKSALDGIREAMNRLDPDRPEAIHDQFWGEIKAVLGANTERLAAESKPASPRQIVHI